MEKQWKNLGVDLQRLARAIEDHYSRRNLKVETTALENGYSIRVIVAELRAPCAMSIAVRGAPSDFTVETRATEDYDRAVKVGLMTAIFGGGSLVLRNIRAREQVERMEREFWSTIEETVRSMTNSRGSLAGNTR
jgi:hypothetical protein